MSDDDEYQGELIVEEIGICILRIDHQERAAETSHRAGEGEDQHSLPGQVDSEARGGGLATPARLDLIFVQL